MFLGGQFSNFKAKPDFERYMHHVFFLGRENILAEDRANECVAFVPYDEEMRGYPFSLSETERESFKEHFIGLLNDDDYKNLCYGSFDWDDPDACVFTDTMYEKMFDLFSVIDRTFGMIYLCVVHVGDAHNGVHLESVKLFLESVKLFL